MLGLAALFTTFFFPWNAFKLMPALPPPPVVFFQPIIKPTFTPPQPTPTSTSTLTPVTPTPTQSVPTSTPQPNLSMRDYLMQQINNYRSSQGLSPVKTDSYTCNFADARAHEISTNFSHDGFTSRINSKTLPYPSYSYITENIAMTSNFKDVVNMWINSPEHASNLRADTPYACVGNYQNYFAYEGWKP
ncbi:MAG: CAP domain-containing protein [Patescibacteria group bacterium]|nr:CAP domain-containing protein [Patescibacteria group bacterium]